MRVGLRWQYVAGGLSIRCRFMALLVLAAALAALAGVMSVDARPTNAAQKAKSPVEDKSAQDAADIGKPGDVVTFKADFPAGAVVVANGERRLYYVLGKGKAIRYPVAVGREDELWTGKSFIQAKIRNPEWVPVDEPEKRVPPGPDNPLGERALYLGWTLYRIHGTNSPRSIGNAASAGCVRMHNFHVKDLFERVHIGAPVFVVDTLASGRIDARPKKLADE